MTDKDFYNLSDWYNAGGGLLPVNPKAHNLMDALTKGEVISFKEMTARDMKFHRCYFSLLAFIWGYMSQSFKNQVPKEKFYIWLKHLKGQYEVLFEFKDGTKLVEYESIAFGNMSEKTFHEYIKNQLPWIYENVIGAYFEGDIYDGIIETIEEDYKKFMSKL